MDDIEEHRGEERPGLAFRLECRSWDNGPAGDRWEVWIRVARLPTWEEAVAWVERHFRVRWPRRGACEFDEDDPVG